eukprot:1004746-Alexandrium_andersonii.AAC.1
MSMCAVVPMGESLTQALISLIGSRWLLFLRAPMLEPLVGALYQKPCSQVGTCEDSGGGMAHAIRMAQR